MTSKSLTFRMWLGFGIIFVILFGLLSLAGYYLIIWKPWHVLGICVLVRALSHILPKPVAWLVTIGFFREVDRNG